MTHRPLWLAACAGAALAFFVLPAAAQTQMLPGLWEHSFTPQAGSPMASAMKSAQEQLAALTPAQRRQMDTLMAGKGVAMGSGPQGNAIRMCLTQAQIDLDEVPQGDRACARQSVQRIGDTMKVRFSCAGSPPVAGEGEITVLSPTAYKGTSILTTTTPAGKTERTQIEQSGQWLAKDCGSVKPLVSPGK